MIKKILSYISWVLTAAGIIVLLGFVRYQQANDSITDINLRITAQHAATFLNYNTTFNELAQYIKLYNKPKFSELNIHQIKTRLLANPYIEDASAFTTLDGKLIVNLHEYNALIRVFTPEQSFYIDPNGIIFPISEQHTERVMIANGNINDIPWPGNTNPSIFDQEFEESALASVYKLAKLLEKEQLLTLLVDQIYINLNNEIELTPKIGHASILIGDMNDLDKKFKNISYFFKEKSGSEEINHYSLINAKYTNQIICTK